MGLGTPAFVGDYAILVKGEDKRTILFTLGSTAIVLLGRTVVLEGMPVNETGVSLTALSPDNRSSNVKVGDCYCLLVGGIVRDADGYVGPIYRGHTIGSSLTLT